MALITLFMGKGPSGFGYGSTAEEVTAGLDLSGKTYLVTGCNSGMGFETVRVLSKRGATVIATARTLEKARAATSALSPLIVPVACELSDPASVRACVQTVINSCPPLDGIICNAGIMALPTLQKAHGYELQFFTNHMGHFQLVTGLLGRLTDTARVVMLSSAAHAMAPSCGIDFANLKGEKTYATWPAYGQAKLANLLFAKELARRFAGTRRTANALHPGVINTNLGRSMNVFMRLGLALAEPFFLKSVQQGAATQCYVATNPSLATVSGQYFADCNLARHTRLGADAALARQLWDESEKIAAQF